LANIRKNISPPETDEMFARISRRYDFLNTVMTAGRHYSWRKKAVDCISTNLVDEKILDIATGTGDFAIALSGKFKTCRVIGLDSVPETLHIATSKTRKKGMTKNLRYVMGDAHHLPFPSEQFKCTTVGFGLRNFFDIKKALREMVRVTHQGGHVITLEIVKLAGSNPIAKIFPVYFKFITPILGTILAGNRAAYRYLPQSVKNFKTADELSEIMEEVGLSKVSYQKLALGTIAIHIGEKSKQGNLPNASHRQSNQSS